jgi:ABC-type protease/lipase transport system fused ATPase/permease subunit
MCHHGLISVRARTVIAIETFVAMNPKSSIGYVPQDVFLIDDTIGRNVALGLPEDEIDPDIETELRDGFDTMVRGSFAIPTRKSQFIKY